MDQQNLIKPSTIRRSLKSSLGAAVIALATLCSPVYADSGLVTIESANDVKTTLDKLTTVLESKGMNVFGRVDHSAGAQKAGLSLPPTELLIFGNPKAGTPLMNCARSIAIDLPQKMLAWEAEDGQVYLTYNSPKYLKSRHSVTGCDKNFEKIAGALDNFAKAATEK